MRGTARMLRKLDKAADRLTRRQRRAGLHLSLAFAAALVPATALAGSFAVMSYNVRGLPPQVIEDRTSQIAAIAPLLEDYHTPEAPYVGMNSIVGLQELFFQDYYDVLTDEGTVSYAYITNKDTGGPGGIGDGLNLLSDFELTAFTRTQWGNCFGTQGDNGSDCDTNKGFSYARVFLEANVFVDVYTLHADAGQDEGSRTARRANITQLVTAINTTSPAGIPVIVLGDTNSRYTRVGNDNLQDLLNGTGVTDVWVQLKRSGLVPAAGPDIEEDCATDPGGANCELVDKIFYRDGNSLIFAPQSYNALKAMFSDNMAAELSDHTPVTVTFDFVVPTTTTTTSTSSTSTSITMPISNLCGDTNADDDVTASDALFVLKTAVGSKECELCICDVNDSTEISATDALRTLKKAVGQDIALNCPACI